MDISIKPLISNVALATKASKASDSIIKGQIEELVYCLKDNHLTYAEAYNSFSSVFDFPALSFEFYEFCNALSLAGSLSFPEHKQPQKNGKISYLENAYSKKALDSFEVFIGSNYEAEADFNSACEAAYSGRSSYTLLPLYNTSNGLMVSLYRLVLKYDLKVVTGKSVLMDDGISETDFLLLSHKNISLADADHMLIDVTRPYDGSIHKFLHILSACGVVIKSINTLPLEYTDERCEHVILIDVSNADINALNCFIHSALSDAVIIGTFPLVK